MSSYAVVCFTDDNDSVGIVPTSWLDHDRSFWPPYGQQKQIDKAVRSAEQPSDVWKMHSVRILGVTGM